MVKSTTLAEVLYHLHDNVSSAVTQKFHDRIPREIYVQTNMRCYENILKTYSQTVDMSRTRYHILTEINTAESFVTNFRSKEAINNILLIKH